MANNQPAKKSGSAGKIFIALMATVIVACVTLFVLVYADIINIAPLNDLLISMGIKKDGDQAQTTSTVTTTSDYEAPTMGSSYEIPIPDSLADYYASISTVISTVDAETSENVQTEAEVYEFLAERGLIQQPITTDYNIYGEFCGSTEISDSSNSKHPYYQTYYVSSSRVVWTINVMNGNITALPASYNSENFSNTPLILSEKKMTTSYDSAANTFYVIVPFTNVLDVKQVNYIDAQLLETLTVEEIEKL